MLKKDLIRLYETEKLSAKEIALKLSCSPSKINYWLKKYSIKKRSLSESQYIKQNPDGDPFTTRNKKIDLYSFLVGLGIGLYWGEGTKASPNSVRLGNTDPDLIRYFILFLIKKYNIKKDRLKFGLQLFSDVNPKKARNFWKKRLNINDSQFYKDIISPSQSTGTYKKKAEYGVLTLYFNNTKLRNILVQEIEKLKKV